MWLAAGRLPELPRRFAAAQPAQWAVGGGCRSPASHGELPPLGDQHIASAHQQRCSTNAQTVRANNRLCPAPGPPAAPALAVPRRPAIRSPKARSLRAIGIADALRLLPTKPTEPEKRRSPSHRLLGRLHPQAGLQVATRCALRSANAICTAAVTAAGEGGVTSSHEPGRAAGPSPPGAAQLGALSGRRGRGGAARQRPRPRGRRHGRLRRRLPRRQVGLLPAAHPPHQQRACLHDSRLDGLQLGQAAAQHRLRHRAGAAAAAGLPTPPHRASARPPQAACCSSGCARARAPPCCMASRRVRWSSCRCRMAAAASSPSSTAARRCGRRCMLRSGCARLPSRRPLCFQLNLLAADELRQCRILPPPLLL